MLSRGGLFVFAVVIAVSHGIDWEVHVTTGDQSNAGTDARVFIIITGPEGTTLPIRLDNELNNFERDIHDTFQISEVTDVGEPTSIRVGQNGVGHSPNWYLKTIRLVGKSGAFSGTHYAFDCECWVSAEAGIIQTITAQETVWRANVFTSNIVNAGTDGAVSLTIFGNLGKTRLIPLKNPGGYDFQRGESNSFVISTADIGTPTNISIRAEADGKTEGWHLAKVVLEDMNGGGEYSFKCNCWFDLDTPEGETTKVIQAVSDD